VWAAKIISDPLHDIKLYHRAPLLLLRRSIAGDIDEMDEAIALD